MTENQEQMPDEIYCDDVFWEKSPDDGDNLKKYYSADILGPGVLDAIREGRIVVVDALDCMSKPVTGETSDGYHTFNELYEHRHALFIYMMLNNQDIAWRSKLHSDSTMFPGWFIAGINTPQGPATYHLPMSHWERCFGIIELQNAPEWDGHTSNDVLKRISSMCNHDQT